MVLSNLSNLLVLQSCIRLLIDNKSAPGRSCVSNAVAVNHVRHSAIWLVRLVIIYVTFDKLGWVKRSRYKSYHLSRLATDGFELLMYTRFYSIRVGVYNKNACLCTVQLDHYVHIYMMVLVCHSKLNYAIGSSIPQRSLQEVSSGPPQPSSLTHVPA